MTRRPARWKSLGLSLAFVAAGLVAKLVPWWALAPLGEQSVARWTIAGLVALALVVAATWILGRRLPAFQHPTLVLLPRAPDGGRAAAALAVGAALFGLVFAIALLGGGLRIEWLGARGAPLCARNTSNRAQAQGQPLWVDPTATVGSGLT